MKQNRILITGFAFFGLIIGYTSGITSSEISQVLITLFFGFMGGKAFIDLKKGDEVANNVAGIILILFSITFITGLNIGIYVKVNRLLTNQTVSNNEIPKSDSVDYLRNSKIKNDLEYKYRNDEIKCKITLLLPTRFYILNV